MAWINNRGKGEHVFIVNYEVDEGVRLISLYSETGADLYTENLQDAIDLYNGLAQAIGKYQATMDKEVVK